MVDSPDKNTIGPVKLTVKVAGTANTDIEIVSLRVDKSLGRIPSAQLTMLDGDMPDKTFPMSDKDDLKPGAEVEISAGYGSDETCVFAGVVVKHGIKISGENYSRLVVECRDKAVSMTVGRKSANYIDKKDSDIIKTLIGLHSGLSADVEATTVTHKGLVQYYTSDWDFLMSRAEVNGLLVNVDGGKVAAKAPATSGSPTLKVTYGIDLQGFTADMDARTQLSSVSGACWDMKTQKVVTEKVTPKKLNAQGDIETADLAKVASPKTFQLQSATPMDKSALKAWAEACQLRSGLSRIRGRMSFQGSANAKVGELIEVEGVGSRFSGNVYVSGVHHKIENGDWITEVDFGLAQEWFSERRDLSAPSAAGLLPGVDGLQVGVVLKLDEDPESQNRIKVSVPVLQAETEGVWARLTSPYASNGVGMVWLPEIGDEVVLGYFNSDPSNPVILGSLYSSKLKIPVTPEAKNNTKTIVTRSKLTVEFDEDKKVVTVSTPGGNNVVLSDGDKSITLEDQNGNKAVLGSSGISLDSPKDIKICAKGGVSISALKKVEVSATQDLKISGLNINAEANMALTAKGNATAEISASGQTTVKGAIVMIN